jgi:hypothetical protein
MRLRACTALLLLISACATPAPSSKERVPRTPRLSNLRRAAALPWSDGGGCVIREASKPWPVLVERCFQALDHDRIRFNDPTRRCAVASAGTAALGIGLCILAAPEIVVGTVIVIGVVVVGAALKEALDAYELRAGGPEGGETAPQTKPAPQELSASRRPKPEPSGQDWLPPVPTEPQERRHRPECKPQRVQHLGGNALHNKCADKVPHNAFSGWDALVNGKNFDALQLEIRTLWEVKTNAIDTYRPYVLKTEIDKQVKEAQRERALAAACGYDFVIGVRTEAHKKLLESRDFTLKVVIMDWC